MKKIIGIALASNVLFFSNAIAQTSNAEVEVAYDDDKIIEVCESKAEGLELGEEEIDAYIKQCIDDSSESFEEDSELSVEDPEVSEEE